jgi:hypothetical protein
MMPAEADDPRFLPIDLWTIEDIVFPPNHASLDRFYRDSHNSSAADCYGLRGSVWAEAVQRVGLPGELRIMEGSVAQQLHRACGAQQ